MAQTVWYGERVSETPFEGMSEMIFSFEKALDACQEKVEKAFQVEAAEIIKETINDCSLSIEWRNNMPVLRVFDMTTETNKVFELESVFREGSEYLGDEKASIMRDTLVAIIDKAISNG